MNLLVTGGAGFIGSNFVRYVRDRTDHRVTVLDALTYAGSRDNLGSVLDDPAVTLVEDDVRNQDCTDDLVEAADAVVHFAAQSHVDRSINSAAEFVSTNIQGTRNLLDSCTQRELSTFVHVSTDEVYGEIAEGSFDEADPLKPRNPYAATKAGADLLVRSYHVTHDVPAVIARPSNNYGPRQHQEKLIPKLILRARQGQSLPLYGDGSNRREWLYVEDTCRAIYTLLESGDAGEIYNVGGGQELSNLEVAQEIIDALDGSDDLIEFVTDRPGHDQRYSVDPSKLESLGWEPRWSFDAGLEATIEHYTT